MANHVRKGLSVQPGVRPWSGPAGGKAGRGPMSAPVGKSPSLREIFEEYGAFVCRSLRRLGISEADLDDMLQEVSNLKR